MLLFGFSIAIPTRSGIQFYLLSVDCLHACAHDYTICRACVIIAESSLTTRSATYSEVETLAVSHILAIVKLTHMGSFLPSSDWLIMLDHRVKHTNVRLSRLIHRNNHILICIRLCILLQELRINFCRFFLKFIYRQLWFWPQVFEAILMRRIYNNFVHDNKLLCMHWLNKFEHWLPD